MQNGFAVRPLVRPGFFRRLFNLPAPVNGYVELENLLASRAWSDVSSTDVEQALRAHGVKSLQRKRAKELFAKALASFASDDLLTDAEAFQLQQLRHLLSVTDAEAREAESEVVHPRYARRVTEVLRDETVSPAEQQQLLSLRKALRIEERDALAMWSAQAKPILERQWQQAVSDRRLTIDEKRALDALARNFGVTVDFDQATRAQLDRMHWYWLMENGTFPTVATPINLQRNETCHFAAAAQMYELRTETQRVNYAGASVRIRIMKGVYYRVGSASAQRITRDVLRHVDSGTLYVTNKRVIFDGQRKNAAIAFGHVLSVVPYSDGVEVEKTSGRNPIFTVADPEWLSVLLSARIATA